MKKLLLILAMVVMLLAVPLVSADASLKASLLRYDPLPAAPGQFVTAYIKLENVGNEDARDVALRIQDKFPFSVVSESQRTVLVGELQSQQSVVKEFQVRVNSEAFIGENQLTVEFTEDLFNDQWQESSFPVDVESDEASLTITKVESKEILPGGEGLITITVKNNEDTVLRNIASKLQMTVIASSTIVDLPFIPLDSATEKRISRLNPGEITTINYNVKAYPSATPGYYKLPLTISYVNDQGVETENSDYIGVIIQAVPELKILLDETTISKESMSGDVTFKFINKGINDLKFLDSELLASDDYEIMSNSQDYIGDLDSDDYRSETYTVKIEDEDALFEIKVDYKDENNEEYSETITVPARYTEAVESKSNTGTIIVILVVVIAGFLYFRHKRKSRKH